MPGSCHDSPTKAQAIKRERRIMTNHRDKPEYCRHLCCCCFCRRPRGWPAEFSRPFLYSALRSQLLSLAIMSRAWNAMPSMVAHKTPWLEPMQPKGSDEGLPRRAASKGHIHRERARPGAHVMLVSSGILKSRCGQSRRTQSPDVAVHMQISARCSTTWWDGRQSLAEL
jgi:hypothetical protein